MEANLIISFKHKKDTVLNHELPHLDELERYSAGTMSAPEVVDFRKRLATENALMQEYELYQTLRAGIKQFHRNRLLKQMEQFESTFQQKSNPAFSFRKLGIAASVAAALGAGIFMWSQQSSKQNNWQASFIDDPGLPVLMSKNHNAYNQAMNFYRQGQYQEALNSLPANNSDTTTYYRGIFWLKLGEPTSAFRYLDPIKYQNQSAFKQKAEYYSAMALWKEGKTAEAESGFRKITDNKDHPFYDISAEILADSF